MLTQTSPHVAHGSVCRLRLELICEVARTIWRRGNTRVEISEALGGDLDDVAHSDTFGVVAERVGSPLQSA
mgnify:CR=1 FL=1